MSREGALIIAIALAVLLLTLLLWSWRRRTRRDADWVAPLGPVPEDATVRHEVPVLYVATTRNGTPLERLAIRGLAFRAAGTLIITDRGIGLAIPGAEPFFFRPEQILSVTQSTVAIDRVVERSGLLSITWTHAGADPVDSFFRPRQISARALVDLIRKTDLIRTATTPTGSEA